MIRFIGAFLCLLAALCARAQKSRDTLYYPWAITISPSHLLHADATALAGVERRFKNGFALLADAGYVFARTYNAGNGLYYANGYALKAALRKYLPGTDDHYLQLQGMHRKADNKINGWVSMNCRDGVGDYSMFTAYTRRRRVTTIQAVYGVLLPVSKNFYFDVYAGAGMRLRHQYMVEQGYCINDTFWDWFNLDPVDGRSAVPVPALGFKLAWVGLKQ